MFTDHNTRFLLGLITSTNRPLIRLVEMAPLRCLVPSLLVLAAAVSAAPQNLPGMGGDNGDTRGGGAAAAANSGPDLGALFGAFGQAFGASSAANGGSGSGSNTPAAGAATPSTAASSGSAPASSGAPAAGGLGDAAAAGGAATADSASQGASATKQQAGQGPDYSKMYSADKYGGSNGGSSSGGQSGQSAAGKSYPRPHYMIPDYKASDFAPSYAGASRDLKKRCVGRCRRQDDEPGADVEDESFDKLKKKRCVGNCRRQDDEPGAEVEDESFDKGDGDVEEEQAQEKREPSHNRIARRCAGHCRRQEDEGEEGEDQLDERGIDLPYSNLLKVPELKLLPPTVSFSDDLETCAGAGQAMPLMPGNCVATASNPFMPDDRKHAAVINWALDGKGLNCDSKYLLFPALLLLASHIFGAL